MLNENDGRFFDSKLYITQCDVLRTSILDMLLYGLVRQ